MSKYGANLPAVLNPVGDTCVQVYIPNHPDYIKLFLRAVRMLEVQRNYARDETMTGAKIVTEQWRDRTITPLIEALANSTGSCGVDGECLAYPPFASFISYSPQNPYTDPDLIPEGFEQPPFFVNGKDPAHDLPNYNKGDVILDFGSINIEPSWDLEKTPRIELCLEGSGVCEIHFLNIVQGGAAIVSLDNPVDLGDIIAGIIGDGIDSIDLNQDIVSLPPETAEEIIIEVEVTTEGEHTIYIYFLPVVNDSLIPLSFGGGLREISLCGNLRPCGVPPPPPPPPLEGVTELKPQFQFTAECGLEYRLLDQEENIVQDWTPVEGWLDNAALCFGGGEMATQEEITAAVVDAAEIISARFLAGQEGNVQGGVNINPDGTVTIAPGGLPADDPATFYDETEAAIFGGTTSLVNALKLFYDKIDFYYGPVNGTPINAASYAKFQIKLYFPCDDATIDIAIDDYYAYRATNGRHVFTPVAATYQYIYCAGSNEQAWARWLSDNPLGYPIAKTTQMHLLSTGLSEAFWTEFFEDGLDVPNLNYLDAACVPSQPETLLMPLLGTAYTTGTSWKANHRLRLTITGYFSDTADTPVNDIRDFWWYRQGSTSQLFFQAANNNMQLGSGITKPTSTIVPYTTANNHKYVCTIDTTGGAGQLQITIPSTSMTTPVTTTGGFTVLIEDLGQI